MEGMLQCPYNASHLILKQRMAAHLIKCRKQNSSRKFEICPFNATHDVPTAELQYHMENCPDGKILDNVVYVMEEPKPRDESPVEVEFPSSSENWDEDIHCGSYLNVKEKLLENKMVFRQPVGLPKSERKMFFRNEVQKFGRSSDQTIQENISKK